MHATRRILQKVAAQSSSSQAVHEKIIIPPRTTWELVKSATKGVYSLLSSQKNRDDLVENYMNEKKGPIINPDILQQADHGGLMILSLYSDLKSPLFTNDKNFNVTEFLDGVKYALSRFHDVQGQLENTLLLDDDKSSSSIDEDSNKDDKSSDSNSNIDDEKNKKNKDDNDVGDVIRIAGPFSSTDDLPTNKSGDIDLEKVLASSKGGLFDLSMLSKANWSKKAQEDPESLAGQLRNMVSDECLEDIETRTIQKHMFMDAIEDGDDGDTYIYEEESSEVNNVALLSARAMVMEVEKKKNVEQSTVDDEERADNIRDDELNIKEQEEDDERRSSSDDSIVPIAAQLEVLYDCKQTFIPMSRDNNNNKDGEPVKEEEDSNNKDKIKDNNDDNKEEKNNTTTEDDDTKKMEPVTKTNVAVAVFQGWLKNPDGTKDIGWRLVGNRQAWEFPALANY